MKKIACLLLLMSAAIAFCVSFSSQSEAVAAWNPTSPQEEIVPVEDSMHEFMEYVFQPTYLRLKQTLQSAPADNKGWKAVKSDSLILAESCNLLFSRKPAEHGDDWVKHAMASKEQGSKLYAAGKAKDFAAATTAWKSMLESCNGCHRQFENGKHILTP